MALNRVGPDDQLFGMGQFGDAGLAMDVSTINQLIRIFDKYIFNYTTTFTLTFFICNTHYILWRNPIAL